MPIKPEADDAKSLTFCSKNKGTEILKEATLLLLCGVATIL